MGLYSRVTGSIGNETRINEPKPFKPIEREQAFRGAYRSYKINGRPKIDVDMFFNRIGKRLIELIEPELKTRTSARIQTTAWIRFFNRIGKRLIELIERELKTRTSARIKTTAWIRFVRDGPPRGLGEAHDEEGQERVELAFNSLMTSVYRGSEMDQIVDGMIANMKFQIEPSATK